jgi:hypothetical protein
MCELSNEMVNNSGPNFGEVKLTMAFRGSEVVLAFGGRTREYFKENKKSLWA